ncbi:MAG: hypothetical protein AAGD05_06610, partial [Bacteroidota bacterium]
MRYLLCFLMLWMTPRLFGQLTETPQFFLFQINQEEALTLAQQADFCPESRHFYQLIDSSSTRDFAHHAQGNFLVVESKGEQVEISLLNRASIQARILNSPLNFAIAVLDSTGAVIDNARVKLDRKTLVYDPATKTYRRKRWKKAQSRLFIQANGELLLLDIE